MSTNSDKTVYYPPPGGSFDNQPYRSGKQTLDLEDRVKRLEQKAAVFSRIAHVFDWPWKTIGMFCSTLMIIVMGGFAAFHGSATGAAARQNATAAAVEWAHVTNPGVTSVNIYCTGAYAAFGEQRCNIHLENRVTLIVNCDDDYAYANDGCRPDTQ